MPIRNQIEAITQTFAEQPTFIYGTVNESTFQQEPTAIFTSTPARLPFLGPKRAAYGQQATAWPGPTVQQAPQEQKATKAIPATPALQVPQVQPARPGLGWRQAELPGRCLPKLTGRIIIQVG
jgi:hypothetical protein